MMTLEITVIAGHKQTDRQYSLDRRNDQRKKNKNRWQITRKRKKKYDLSNMRYP